MAAGFLSFNLESTMSYCKICNEYNSSVSNMILNLSWDTLEHRQIKPRLCPFYKILHGLVAIPVEQYIQPCTFLQACRSHQYKFHLIFLIRTCINLPFSSNNPYGIFLSEIVTCDFLCNFKLRLNNYLLL